MKFEQSRMSDTLKSYLPTGKGNDGVSNTHAHTHTHTPSAFSMHLNQYVFRTIWCEGDRTRATHTHTSIEIERESIFAYMRLLDAQNNLFWRNGT